METVFLVTVAGGAAAAVGAELGAVAVPRLVGKAVASAAFVALGVHRWSPGDPVGAWLVLGLALGAVGDVALAVRGGFRAGLAAFLGAHLAYLAAFAGTAPPVAWPWPALLPAGTAAAAAWVWLEPYLGRARRAVAAYLAAATAMVWGATAAVWLGALPVRVAVGAWLFFLSDLAVARQRFVRPHPVNRTVGLPVYYLGQSLIALAAGGR